MECTVCCESYNKSVHKPITCDFCSYQSCMLCIKTYLLKTYHNAHCMNCRKEWSHEFLHSHFPKTWLVNDYRDMREIILFEEEKTYLPELQAAAERQKQLLTMENDIKENEKRLKENEENIDQTVRNQRLTRIHHQQEIEKLKSKRYKYIQQRPDNTSKPVIMKCTIPDCRGFLNENWNCGICQSTICKSCHTKTDDLHQCNPNEVATIKELEKTTKPCPKCYIRIYKIDGCDQMFCIQCHTAFSWNTGKVESGIIHNPHYFEALRRGNIIEHRHYQEHGGCGPIPRFSNINTMIKTLSHEIQQEIIIYYQRLTHFRQVVFPQFNYQENDLIREERIKYLIGLFSEDKFKSKIYIRSQRVKRKEQEHQIIQTYLMIGEELFRNMKPDNILDIKEQLKELKRITNEAIRHIEQSFQHKAVLHVNDII